MKLTVVIPALSEAAAIEAAVRSAVDGTGADAGVEIIVVDGGSEDGTAERAAAAGARVIHSERGRARQLGLGARESRGDALVFLHADTRLPRGWASAVRTALADPEVVGGAFGLRFDHHSPMLRVVEAGARMRHAWLGMPYGDQALFVRRAVLEAIGGVPQAPIMEDLDLVRAMKQAGRLARVPLDAVTSARRHRAHGPLRVALRHLLAHAAWALGLDRARVAAWVRR